MFRFGFATLKVLALKDLFADLAFKGCALNGPFMAVTLTDLRGKVLVLRAP